MARRNVFSLLPIAAVFLSSPPSQAQSTAKRPEFEVAAIKLNPGCDPRKAGGGSSPGRLNLVCATLREYIGGAYGTFDGPLPRGQRLDVVGGPRWVDTDRYDISGKAEEPTPRWQMRTLMLQALLEQRFQVKVHTEAIDTSVYVLTVVRNDAGLKRSAEGSCTPQDLDNQQQISKLDPQARIALLKSAQKPCGSGSFKFDGPNTIAEWSGLGMAELAGFALPGRVGRPVVDKTGLKGLFDIHLEFFEDRAPQSSIPSNSLDAPTPSAVATGPSIFQALQQQLGLKLTSARAPIDVIVIDRAERPSEN